MKKVFSYLMMLVVALNFVACDEDKPNDEPATGKAKLVLACDMAVVGSDVSYLIPVTDDEMNGGQAALSRAHEVYSSSRVASFNGYLYSFSGMDKAVIYRYSRKDDGSMVNDASLQLSNNAGAMLANVIFISETKAYASLMIENKIVVFNPTDMTKTKEIDLAKAELSCDGKATPNPMGMVLRDDKVFVGCGEYADMPISNDGAHIIVIDEATDTPEKFISDMRASTATFWENEIFVDESGDVYINCWASYGFVPGQKAGFLRIKKGETDFDPDYFLDFSEMNIAGVEGGKLTNLYSTQYAENGIVYAVGSCPALFTGDFLNDHFLYSLKIDLYNKTISPLSLPLTNAYATAVGKMGNEILFGLSTASNGVGVFSYNHLTGHTSSSPIVNAPGSVMSMAVFE